MPTVVIGDHGDRRVTNLRFARQPRFRHVGHAYHFKAKLSMHFRLGQRGELRPFDADVRSATMNHNGLMDASVRQDARQLVARRMRKPHRSANSLSKKSGGATFRTVAQTVRYEELSPNR